MFRAAGGVLCLGRGIWVWSATLPRRALWRRILLTAFVWAASFGAIFASRDSIGYWFMD